MDQTERRAFLDQLETWHQEDEFQKIIDAVEALPKDEQDYSVIGLMARAYENKAGYGETEPLEHAIELLQSTAKEGVQDPNWHFRMGYALYYLDREAEAIPYFQTVLNLISDDPDTQEFWSDAREFLEKCVNDAQSKVSPERYTEEELNAVEAHINKFFGNYDNVFHELYSPDIHVDICVIKPTPERNYYTLVTMGAGAHRMNVPKEIQNEKLDRAEMMICLPPDWKIGDSQEDWYWPLRWLKIMARLPGKEESWLGWGHTVSNPGEVPFADNTQLCGIMLLSPGEFAKGADSCTLPDGDIVRFYQLIPLYREEMDYKLHTSANALLHRFQSSGEGIELTPMRPDRPNACMDNTKEFYLKREDIRPILTNWRGVEGCLATDRILVDGQKVGFCYREKPTPDNVNWDSGWRFTAGDEDKDYMDDAKNSGVYHLNTICNYDQDILPLLHAPYGAAFRRDENGVFHLVPPKRGSKDIHNQPDKQ
ncbi:Suppressor of fused protein (SUFU) [Eubacteriaceae bacterium CHKCI005]|nr:Suppressor of fused protein (SUFU) [Eubacteriaceae bacterium CHKCI005]